MLILRWSTDHETIGRVTSSMDTYGDPAIRITLLPRDTNPQGTIFGGIILSYIDMAGAGRAPRRTGGGGLVPVAPREGGSPPPGLVGDLARVLRDTARIGTASLTARAGPRARGRQCAG